MKNGVVDLLESTGCGHEVAAPVLSLGNNADFALTPPLLEPLTKVGCDIHTVLPPPVTVKAWYLRSLGRELLKSHGISRRMRWCGSRIARRVDGVNLYARPDRAYGRVSGVCVCGQSICCPVCAPRIAAFRASEVSEAYQRAMDAGWEARLETFTKPHQLDARPNALLDEFQSFSDLWRRFTKNIDRHDAYAEGSHLAREINWGANGWHYHHHRLRYDKPDSYDQDRTRAQWLAVLDGAGLFSSAAERHAYDCSAVKDDNGARYVAKLATSVEAQCRAIGSELASSATKGRNMNSLLADHARGDLQAGSTWVNGVACVTATKISSVRWSRNLRYKLGMDGGGKSDAQIAQEETTATDEFLGSLNPFQWRGVLQWRAEFPLCVAANRGLSAVNEFLTGLDLGNLNDEPPPRVETPIKGDYAYARL